MRAEVRRNAFNEAKKELWAAKEPLKSLRERLPGDDEGLSAADCREVRDTLDAAIHSLALVGSRLRELEEV